VSEIYPVVVLFNVHYLFLSFFLLESCVHGGGGDGIYSLCRLVFFDCLLEKFKIGIYELGFVIF
jgi:hypothetical protein